MFGSAQKGIKHWILNRFLLVNSEMWIRTAIKLPHDLGVCQKTEGNSAGDFHGGDERKHRHPGLGRQLNHQLPPVSGENHLCPLRNNYRPNRAKDDHKLQQLETYIRQEWDQIPTPKLQKLITSMPRRLQLFWKEEEMLHHGKHAPVPTIWDL